MSLLFDTKTDVDGTPILYIRSPLEDLAQVFGRFFNIYVIIFAVALGIVSLAVIFKTRTDSVTSNTGLQEPMSTTIPSVNPNVRNHKAGYIDAQFAPTHQPTTWTNSDNRVNAGEYRYYGLQKTPYPKRRYYGLQNPIPPSSWKVSNQQWKGFRPGLSSNHPSPRISSRFMLTKPSNGSYDTNRCEAPFHLRTYYGCPKVNDRPTPNSVPNNANSQIQRYVNFGDLPTGISQLRLARIRSVLI